MLRTLSILVCALLVPSRLAAQEVAGRITTADAAPVAGGLVELLDSAGRVAADAATDRAGRFLVRAPSPGSYRVRAGQVGFQSARSAPLALARGERRELSLAITRSVVTLEGIRAVGRPRCEATPTSGAELARVWDEARKALALTLRTAADSSVGYEFATYTRTVQTVGDSVLEDSAVAFEMVGGVPFFSAPLNELDRHGFVREIRGQTTFFGPDAQTILSPTFLSQHCFSLRDGSGARAGQIGLAFEPVPARRRPDVTGVLWLDARSGELRELEWGYTRVEAPPEHEPRGRAEFMRLPNGAWIIERWALRIPFARSYFDRGRRGTRLVFSRIEAVREVGGEVGRLWDPREAPPP